MNPTWHKPTPFSSWRYHSFISISKYKKSQFNPYIVFSTSLIQHSTALLVVVYLFVCLSFLFFPSDALPSPLPRVDYWNYRYFIKLCHTQGNLVLWSKAVQNTLWFSLLEGKTKHTAISVYKNTVICSFVYSR